MQEQVMVALRRRVRLTADGAVIRPANAEHVFAGGLAIVMLGLALVALVPARTHRAADASYGAISLADPAPRISTLSSRAPETQL